MDELALPMPGPVHSSTAGRANVRASVPLTRDREHAAADLLTLDVAPVHLEPQPQIGVENLGPGNVAYSFTFRPDPQAAKAGFPLSHPTQSIPVGSTQHFRRPVWISSQAGARVRIEA